ncbi:uncharacterized protein LOC112520148 [Cynara cardunculus var. scolymus]|uniref:uncharacterized protein LOC112520148 n=1 Tax=Cynara cardunculus var. scolymus TaxID=59895 RepID=UPI000D623CEC|nr:uncharacterized protein LOC112520148 [Cynara cardunculus var. scolymus]
MATAGLHKASLQDSYIGENHSPASRRCGNKERSTTHTSSIRKMWRDLESEGRVGENGRKQMSGMQTGNESRCSSSLGGESMESEDTSRDANEIENECPQNQNQNQNQNQVVLHNRQEDNNRLSLQQSPFDVPEKERVRKIFHEWGSKSFGGHTSYNSHINNCSRSQWLGENECKRVRVVRDQIELSTQQGDGCRTGLEEPATEIGSHIRRVQDGSVDCGVGARRPIRRIYGRQALLDLLTKFERERETELESLLENRFVSNFAHRHRIQSSLKGRFLRNQRFVEGEKQTSVAANELGLLRQTQAVSDIRKGFLSRLNNHDHAPDGAPSDSDTSSDNDMIEQADEIVQEIPDEIGEEFETTNLASGWEACNPQEFATSVGERHENILQYEESEELPLTETRSQDHDGSVETNQNIYHSELSRGTLGTECIAHGPLPEVDEVMLGQSNVEELEIHEAPVCLHPLQTSTDSFNWQEVSTQAEEWKESSTEDDDEGGWHHLTRIDSDVNLNDNEDGWYQETVGSDFQELHEEWYDNTLEDSTESWFVGNSYQEAAPVGGSYAFYLSDDDNGSRFELGELTSRRRVSNLLQSDFGARLNQLLQSYVDRQDQAFDSENEWSLGREQQNQEQQSLDENPGGIEAHLSASVIPQTESNNDLQGAADRQFPDINQHFGTGRDIINGLRIDMDMLQQRMNDMQRMLEACMGMQLELQRSMQQEVYSALNRSSNSGGTREDGIQNFDGESSHGKRGVCFVCCNDGFDSPPNKSSAHMYICSKCAEKINWSKLKGSVRHP